MAIKSSPEVVREMKGTLQKTVKEIRIKKGKKN